MNDYQVLPVQGDLAYTVDFTDVLPAAVTLSSVAWTISPQITLASQSNDYANALSTIKVSGATHAVQYVLQALGTLSNGEVVPKDVALLGFNG